ncbi:MAG: hypothetical protein KKB81_01435 [Candidatus Margulisbacteria bacterium]|nr:hypothetical protein [Candidatus Margulisiibacteriota bacterium]MBU1021577.1 hypothetical protein [Candidatus Margulisiibacteriota bacterium]MBU1728728.1 hypothetical protein [Candidatus Margulisiibacteriota bacterium]MBU1955179.1 hypothetical protein [Candidatus Margulisiibacteriota bacterium]
MKRFLLIIVLLISLASFARAEVLSSAIPVSLGQWVLAPFIGQQTNVNNNSALSQTLYGFSAGYGLCDRTELDLIYEYGTFSGVPGMEMLLQSYSCSLKYNLLLEAPVSLSVGANYSLISQRDNFAGSPSGSNYGFKVLISKVFSSLHAYVCLNRSITSLAGESSATEATLGGMWVITNQIVLITENTWQLQSAGYTSNQLCFSAAYVL